MRRHCLTAALMLCAATAQADEPLPPAQEVQFQQSALALIGYDIGPMTGEMNENTESAVSDFVYHQNLVLSDDDLDVALKRALIAMARARLAERFGTDPWGAWDIDWVASGLEEYSQGRQTCEDGGWGYFAEGIVFRDWETRTPIVFSLVDDRLEALPPPSGAFIEPFAFTFIDDSTMHRHAEGQVEVWVRCDDWRVPADGAL